MNEVEPVFAALWWMPYVFLFCAIDAAVRTVRHTHHAICLWQLRRYQISDPSIAEALADIKPPRYWIHALVFAVCTAGCMFLAITWPR